MQERRADLQEAAPLYRKAHGLTETQHARLATLADATAGALALCKSAERLYEWTRPLTHHANGAALARAALEKLVEELREVEELHGVELLPPWCKRG